MGTTSTSNLVLIKPNPFEEDDTWGPILNSNWDTIAALFDAGPVLKVSRGGTGAGTAALAIQNLDTAQFITSSAGTTTLTNTSPRNIVVTGSTTHTIVLPAVSTLALGWTIIVHNLNSSGTITVQSSGLNAFSSQNSGMSARYICVAITGTGTASWKQVFEGSEVVTGSGSLVYNYGPTMARIRFTAANVVTAGTNAQGQGALSETYNIITTAAANPSGVTLPSPSSTSTTSTLVRIVNRGANPVNVYPASGHSIDSLAANASIQIPVNGIMEFWSVDTNKWYSSVNEVYSALSMSGTLPVASGGTGATTVADARTALGVGTADSPEFAGINVGNASDTTITRSAAGVLAVEGGVIPKENRANTFTEDQTISKSSGDASYDVSSVAGAYRSVKMRTSGVLRWEFGANTVAEAGSDAGSDFYINRFSDAGAYLGSAMNINRKTGFAIFEAGNFQNGLQIGGVSLNARAGYTLLGTITTTSGSSQALPGLTLTGYKFLRLIFSGVSHSSGTTQSLRVEGQQIVAAASSSVIFSGIVEIALVNGVGVANVDAGGPNTPYVINTSLSTASTSVTVSVSGGNFDAGSVVVYGVS